jgi:hypothetical protein
MERTYFMPQFNTTDDINFSFAVNQPSQVPLLYQDATAEIKRMYVSTIGGKELLTNFIHRAQWAVENHFSICILETGQAYPEAIVLI